MSEGAADSRKSRSLSANNEEAGRRYPLGSREIGVVVTIYLEVEVRRHGRQRLCSSHRTHASITVSGSRSHPSVQC